MLLQEQLPFYWHVTPVDHSPSCKVSATIDPAVYKAFRSDYSNQPFDSSSDWLNYVPSNDFPRPRQLLNHWWCARSNTSQDIPSADAMAESSVELALKFIWIPWSRIRYRLLLRKLFVGFARAPFEVQSQWGILETAKLCARRGPSERSCMYSTSLHLLARWRRAFPGMTIISGFEKRGKQQDKDSEDFSRYSTVELLLNDVD